jgi:DNA-binding PadR family transcriptional regulator
MSSRSLNATAASLLGFLHEGPLTGWDLVATAQQRIGDFWSLTQSQVYRELTSMAADGLIEAGERGRRDRRPYSITDAGRAAFSRWLSRTPEDETIRFPLLLTVVFGRHLPKDRLAEIVVHHRGLHAERLVEYEKARELLTAREGDDPIDAYHLAPLDFGIRYEAAALAWFDALPDDIKGAGRP